MSRQETHIAQFAHREGIGRSQAGLRTRERLSRPAKRLPTPLWRSDFKIRLRFAHRCGGSPGIERLIPRLHRIPVSLASLTGLVKAPDNGLRLSQTGGNDNTSRDPDGHGGTARRSPVNPLAVTIELQNLQIRPRSRLAFMF